MKNLKLLLVSLAILFSHNLTMGQGPKDGKTKKALLNPHLTHLNLEALGLRLCQEELQILP